MKEQLDKLEALILSCGREAVRYQGLASQHLKVDGTVVTDEDLLITQKLSSCIEELFPKANIVSEEMVIKPFDEEADLTFVFDPIDGTDSYSQGIPLWCIGVGILNKKRQPVGSLLYIPFPMEEGMIIRTDPDSPDVYAGGRKLVLPINKSDVLKEIVIGSSAIRLLPLSRLSCRFRALGSAILHSIMPVMYPRINGGVTPPCYVWDIAPAHAVVLKAGFDYQYVDGEQFFYNDELLIHRRKFEKPIVIGDNCFRKSMIEVLSC